MYPLYDIKTVKTAASGALSFFEEGHDIDMSFKRIFYIHGVAEGENRGGHAHKENKQFLFCVYGSVLVTYDDGKTKEKYVLDNPGKGLFVKPGIWLDLEWITENSVLCVVSSDYYDESDYIRDYDEFLRWINES